MDLSGKTVVVCGASKGIGRATAQQMAHYKARVIAVARSEDLLQSLIKDLDKGAEHGYFCTDLSDAVACRKLAADILSAAGRVDVLINNAAGPKGGPITEAEPEDFLNAAMPHIGAAMILTKSFLPGMKQAQSGRIINVLSTSVKIPIPNLGISNMIRAAMANWAKTLSVEVAPFGITVNNILPGFTKTDRLNSLIAGAAANAGTSADEMSERWRATIPAGRFGSPKETADAIAFLASDQAGYINGVSLPVDGGRTGCH